LYLPSFPRRREPSDLSFFLRVRECVAQQSRWVPAFAGTTGYRYGRMAACGATKSQAGTSMSHNENGDHHRDGHAGAHDHDHDDHHDGGSTLSELDLRVRALESLLVEKGYVDPGALDVIIETYESKVGPRNGAQVVAKAWADAGYREWLLADATQAIASLGHMGRQGEHMVALENTARVHNMVVCTLCSCYPWPILGLPPVWYKSAPYRSRAVIDPRGVLADFGVTLPAEVELRVWDSTAEIRYLVLPQRPSGTENWTAEQLEALVTRDSMIGTGVPRQPHRPPAQS
jgi:nitrile hydratase